MGETGGDQRRFGFPGPARPEREQDYSCFRKADPRRAAGFGSSRKRHCPLLPQLRTGIVCDSRHTPKQNRETMELRGTILGKILVPVHFYWLQPIAQSDRTSGLLYRNELESCSMLIRGSKIPGKSSAAPNQYSQCAAAAAARRCCDRMREQDRSTGLAAFRLTGSLLCAGPPRLL